MVRTNWVRPSAAQCPKCYLVISLLVCCLSAAWGGPAYADFLDGEEERRVIPELGTFGNNHTRQLLSAARRGEKAQVKSLLAAGANVNAKNEWGDTPLILAARQGHIDIVEILLAAGADMKLRTPNDESQGLRALKSAISGGHVNIVKILLSAGAAAQATGRQRTSLISEAQEAGQTAIAQLLKDSLEFSAVATGQEQNPNLAQNVKLQELSAPPSTPTPASEEKRYKLTIQANPADSRIAFLHSRAKYSPRMPLRPGSYQVQVEKEGYESKQQEVTLADADLVVEITLQPRPTAVVAPSTAATPSRRLALVVGNAAYESGALRNPVNDASDMAATLERLGFQVTLLRDASQRKMEETVDAFSRQLQDGGVGLFYFAGHGVQLEGQNYLIPIGARLNAAVDAKYHAIAAGWVLERMSEAGNAVNLIILDACRDNPFKRQWRSSQRGLAVMESVPGALIAYATAPGGVADDGSGRNGLYTQQLLRYMVEPGMSVEQMFKRVRIAVAQATQNKQVPWEASSLTVEVQLAGGKN